MQGSFPCWTRGELVSSALRSPRPTQLVPICSMAPQRALNTIDRYIITYGMSAQESERTFFNWNDQVTYLPLQRRLWPPGWTDLPRCCCRRPLSHRTGSEVQCCRLCKYTSTRQVMPQLSGSKCCCQAGGTPQRSRSPCRSGVPPKPAECRKWHRWPQTTEVYSNCHTCSTILCFR